MSTIVQIANLVPGHHPTTSEPAPRAPSAQRAEPVGALARHYAEHGHRVAQILPGCGAGRRVTDWGVQLTLPAPALPGSGSRVLANPLLLRKLIGSLLPDRLELHGRGALRGLGGWAARQGLPCLTLGPGLFGVDLERFHPDRASEWIRQTLAPRGERLLVWTGRLTPGGGAEQCLAVVAELTRRGERVRLVLIGDGPARRRLERRAAGLAVRFLGELPDAEQVATVLASAEVALALGQGQDPVAAALRPLACGTPVVVEAGPPTPTGLTGVTGRIGLTGWATLTGVQAPTELAAATGLAALTGPAGLVGPRAGVAATGVGGFADAVQLLLAEPGRREQARGRAEQFGWDRAAAELLTRHGLPVRDDRSTPRAAGSAAPAEGADDARDAHPLVPRPRLPLRRADRRADRRPAAGHRSA